MKTIWLLFSFFLVFPIHAGTLFINSIPQGADVFSKDKKTSKKEIFRRIGKTPLKIEDVSDIILIVSQKGYTPQTNTYQVSKNVDNLEIVLAPLSFTVNFPAEKGALFVNNKPYSSLDGNLILPYGNYDTRYDKKRQTFSMNYKSPYTASLGIFTTITILSIGMGITGGLLSAEYKRRFNDAPTLDEAVKDLTVSATWNNVMLTSIGIGTGAFIGTAIFAHYENKERKRIRRFNALNSDFVVAGDLNDFNALVLNPTEEKLSAFIRTYKGDDSRYLPQVYLYRAQYYLKLNKSNAALKDLRTIISDYPVLEIYGTANKLLGDIYLERKDYYDAYLAYKEAAEPSSLYPELMAKAYYALSRAVQRDKKHLSLLRDEIEKGKVDKKLPDKTILAPYLEL